MAFDPFGAEHRADPYPAYAELRRRAPVCRTERSGAYAVARYADVAFVLRHPELFSSTAMQTALLNRSLSGGAASGAGISPDDLAGFGELLQAMPFSMVDVLGARFLIAVDPPAHAPMRGLVNRGFTPRRIAALEPRIREIARASLDAVAGKSEIELMQDVAIPLPVTVIAELLGVEPERTADFKRWSDCLIAGVTGVAGALRPGTMLQAFVEMGRYIGGVVEARRAEPRDDLISALVRAEDGEAALAPVEMMMFTVLLLVAGNETTTNLLGNTLVALTENPAQLARVQDEPGLVPALVEEALRYCGPVQLLYREATRDVELAGVRIPAGALVTPLLGSANRDESQFEQADRLDASRSTQGHLAFGLGIHFCLGASLARLEARVALEELLARYVHFERLDPHVEYIDSLVVRGPRRLRLGVESAG